MTAGKIHTAPESGRSMQKAIEELRGRQILVVGLAGTGLAVCRFLSRCGAIVTGTDMANAASIPGAPALTSIGVVLKTGGHQGIETKAFSMAVVSPGVPSDIPLLKELRANGAEVISDIELAYRYIGSPVIAVAGTNGKTTTTTLLGKVLEDAGFKVFVGGNIGTPAVECVEAGREIDVCLLEISSFHLENTKSFNPHVGILLNITEDHLDRYEGFGHYAATKFRLFENQTAEDYAVVNINDPVIARQASAKGLGRGKVVLFTVAGTLTEGLFLRGGDIVYSLSGVEETYPVSEFGLKGLHNIENIMAVIASARLSGVSRDSIMATLREFKGLHHRMEMVRTINGVAYIDDSKGTNIGALVMALRGSTGRVVLIAGGRDKGGDYAVLADLVREKVKCLILLGEARFKMKDALGGLTQTVLVESLEEAVALSSRKAEAGDTVLLCPACSSFDMFKSYKERGERFRAFVEALC